MSAARYPKNPAFMGIFARVRAHQFTFVHSVSLVNRWSGIIAGAAHKRTNVFGPNCFAHRSCGNVRPPCSSRVNGSVLAAPFATHFEGTESSLSKTEAARVDSSLHNRATTPPLS
jgi:hypothetical protein